MSPEPLYDDEGNTIDPHASATHCLRVTCFLMTARARFRSAPASSVRLAVWYAVDTIGDGDEALAADLLALFTPEEREAVGPDAVRAIGRVLGTDGPSAREGTVRP